MGFCRRLTFLSLSVLIALQTPVYAQSVTYTPWSLPISETVSRASEFRVSDRSPLARLGLTAMNLDNRYTRALLKTSSGFLNEIFQFQALLIMMGVAHYQMVKERAEMERLSNGLPGSTDPSLSKESSKEICASRNYSNPSEDMLCSGEFLIGMGAGAGLLTSSVIVKTILSTFLKTAANRSALLKVIGTIGTMTLMIAGGSAASFLWTESVKLLPTQDEIDQAHGIAGRAALAYSSSSQWQAFKLSKDGELWDKLMGIMNKVLFLDSDLRSSWITNTLRFGMRGELLSSLATLMAAAPVGAAAANGAIGLATASGAIVAGGTAATVSTPVLAFVMGAGFGFVALNLIFGNDVPGELTKILQNIRSWSNYRSLVENQNDVEGVLRGFHSSKSSISHSKAYVTSYGTLLDHYFKQRAVHRNKYITVGIEQIYELRLAVESLRKKLAIAEAALKASSIQPLLYVSFNGKILSFKDAKAQLCKQQPDQCVEDSLYHLQKFRELSSRLREADEASLTAAKSIVDLYDRESTWLESRSNDSAYIYPYTVSSRISEEIKMFAFLKLYFKYIFGSADKIFAKVWPTSATSPDQEKNDRIQSFKDIGEHYQLTYDENRLYESLTQATAMPTRQ